MSRHISQIAHTSWIPALCAAAAVAVALTATAHARSLGPRSNLVSVTRPVALPGVVLDPGEYVFEVLTAGGGSVVRVSTSAGNTKYLGITLRAERPRNIPAGVSITLGEAPAGQPQPIRAWFPEGLDEGHQFLYR